VREAVPAIGRLAGFPAARDVWGGHAPADLAAIATGLWTVCLGKLVAIGQPNARWRVLEM